MNSSTLFIISEAIISNSKTRKYSFDPTKSLEHNINSSKSNFTFVVESILEYVKISKDVAPDQKVSVIYGDKTPKILNSWEQQSLFFMLKQFSIIHETNESFENFEELFSIHCSNMNLRIVYFFYSDQETEELNQLLKNKFQKLKFEMIPIPSLYSIEMKKKMSMMTKEFFGIIQIKLNNLPLKNKIEEILIQVNEKNFNFCFSQQKLNLLKI
jgi:hypothetical protein